MWNGFWSASVNVLVKELVSCTWIRSKVWAAILLLSCESIRSHPRLWRRRPSLFPASAASSLCVLDFLRSSPFSVPMVRILRSLNLCFFFFSWTFPVKDLILLLLPIALVWVQEGLFVCSLCLPAAASAVQTNQECVHYTAGEELAAIDFVLVLGYQGSDCWHWEVSAEVLAGFALKVTDDVNACHMPDVRNLSTFSTRMVLRVCNVDVMLMWFCI